MNEEQTDKGPGEQPPRRGWMYFEEWLQEQTHREDNTGILARFILEDLERGCWPTSLSVDVSYAATREEKERERQHRAFRKHLIAFNNPTAEGIFLLERMFREFLEDKDRVWKEWCAWAEVWAERHGYHPLMPVLDID